MSLLKVAILAAMTVSKMAAGTAILSNISTSNNDKFTQLVALYTFLMVRIPDTMIKIYFDVILP